MSNNIVTITNTDSNDVILIAKMKRPVLGKIVCRLAIMRAKMAGRRMLR